MAKRNSKTAAQQCRYYEVGNIFEYMVETYINGNLLARDFESNHLTTHQYGRL